jgi:ankyrin repeat protein
LNACASGDERRVRDIVDGEGALLINAQKPETGATALQRATEFGRVEIVTLLIARGAQPNISGKDNQTPLFQAAYNGFVPIVDSLLKAGANPNVTESRFGDTPLILAAWKGHMEVVERLVLAGADVNARAQDGRTALQLAHQKKDVSMAKFLGDHGASELDAIKNQNP